VVCFKIITILIEAIVVCLNILTIFIEAIMVCFKIPHILFYIEVGLSLLL
jgi:hypothetical protein